MKVNQIVEIVFKVFVISVLGFLFFRQLDSEKSIVYVDSIKLMSQYNGMKSAKTELEAKVAVWKANVDSLRAEFEVSIKEYEFKKSRLSPSERKLTEELLTTKQQQFLSYQQAIQEKIQKEDQELTNKVLGKVNDYIRKYGEKKGYDIIMAATQFGNIVYAKDGVDITNEIIEGLNKGY